VTFPGDHGGFLGDEYGQRGEPDAFAVTLSHVLSSEGQGLASPRKVRTPLAGATSPDSTTTAFVVTAAELRWCAAHLGLEVAQFIGRRRDQLLLARSAPSLER
jgi:hypothetical protein